MLPKHHRIRKNNQFQAAYRQGKRFSSPYFTVYRQTRLGEPLRVGIVTSKKVGNAVTRNRIRRLIREVLRLRWSEWSAGFNLVIVVQPSVAGMTFQQVNTELETLLQRAEVASGHSRGRDL